MKPAKPKEKKPRVYECSLDKLAEVLGITPRYVQKLASEGDVVGVRHGVYDLAKSVRGFVAYKLRGASANGPGDYQKERTMLVRAKREKEELDLALRLGTVGDMEIMMELWANRVSQIKSKFLGIPSVLAGQLSNETDPNVISDLLTGKIAEALNELAGSVQDELVREYLDRHGQDAGAPAEADVEPMV